MRHEAITLGKIPDLSIAIPIDATGFQLLVIQQVLGDAGAAEQGLSTRLKQATDELRVALSRAASELAEYQVSRSDLELLVEIAVLKAKDSTRKALAN